MNSVLARGGTCTGVNPDWGYGPHTRRYGFRYNYRNQYYGYPNQYYGYRNQYDGYYGYHR